MLFLYNEERFDVQIYSQTKRNPWAEAFRFFAKDIHSAKRVPIPDARHAGIPGLVVDLQTGGQRSRKGYLRDRQMERDPLEKLLKQLRCV